MIEIVEENGMWYVYKTDPETKHRYVIGISTSSAGAEAKKRKEEAK